MKVRVFGTLRTVFAGQKEIDVPASGQDTARQLLVGLIATFPGLKDKVSLGERGQGGGVNVFVNGRSIRFLEGLDTPLHEGDELALFPPVGGG